MFVRFRAVFLKGGGDGEPAPGPNATVMARDERGESVSLIAVR